MENLIRMGGEWYRYKFKDIDIDLFITRNSFEVDLEPVINLSELGIKLGGLQELTSKLTEIKWYLIGKLDKEKEIREEMKSKFLE